MAEFVSKEERKEMGEDANYYYQRHPDQHNRIAQPHGPVVPESERGETSYEEEVEYYNQTHPQAVSNPNPADQDAQQRKQERELKELENSRYGSEREEQESEVEHYREQHPERSARDKQYVVKKKAAALTGIIAGKAKDVAVAGWGNLKKNLAKPIQRADEIRERNANRQPVQPRYQRRPRKETKGEFKPARYSGGLPGGGKTRDAFPDIDPFGGMGGRGTHMLDLSFGGLGAPSRQQAPQQQAPVRRPPPPRPVAKKMFEDPFKGIKAGSGKGNPLKEIGKGLGIGKGTGKKLKKMDDWMRF